MARILVTGSSDGIGLLAARTLIKQGHEVHLHARNVERSEQTKTAAPGAAGVLIGDISTLAGMKTFAADANKTANPFDVVVHNAGVGMNAGRHTNADGVLVRFAVNSLAPYVLTALMARPKRLIYTSSGMHTNGDGSLKDITNASYSDTKLHNVMLANAVARRWKEVQVNSVDPGWVASKLAGSSAPGQTQDGADTLVDLANPGLDQDVGTGQYFTGRKPRSPQAAGIDEAKQEQLMTMYEKLSGVQWPSK
ncbi:MAG: hypothetical protein M1828_006813 [Chrysothrix sp. TS-e1954]|nr:MAG: hypothetical protein M1828_006813 [Chrysothrix sp. TS-e1954]